MNTKETKSENKGCLTLFFGSVLRTRLTLLVVLVFLLLLFYVNISRNNNIIDIERNMKIEKTNNVVKGIREISKWEFLTIDVEEIADTVQGTILVDELSMIFRGKLRFGCDMSDFDSLNITYYGDTIDVVMPEMSLLETDFIDDVRTTVVYENGSFSTNIRSKLREKAKKEMMLRYYNRENINKAKSNGEKSVSQLFYAAGYNTVIVHWK